MISTWAAVHLLAAASGLVVIALALSRGESSPLRRPLALLAASQFAWNAATVGVKVTHLEAYVVLGGITVPLFPPLAFHFVVTFLGKRRRLRHVLFAAYAVFGAQSLLAAIELVLPGTQIADGRAVFATLLLVSSLPLALYAMGLVGLHLHRAGSELEKLRSRVLLFALVTVVCLLVTDPLADLQVPVPRLATLGSFSFNALLTHLTLGLGLFTSTFRKRVALGQAVVLGLFFAVSALAIFTAFSEQLGVLITALTALSLMLAVSGWLVVTGGSAAKAGLERFAVLGRFSAQMAHDLKNPLAAAKGAAEYLVEELRRAGGGPNQEFASMVVSQLDRLHAVIDRYQRLSKLEPHLRALDANQLVTRVLSLQHFAVGEKVKIETRLANPPPLFQGDADLLASALENLVKNGIEAMPDGGILTVATETAATDDDGTLVLSVKDTGQGLDARAREQAFELFFTTKATGSGLGLAFVRQVAQAHGGDAKLISREGAGTTVSLLLPLNRVSP